MSDYERSAEALTKLIGDVGYEPDPTYSEADTRAKLLDRILRPLKKSGAKVGRVKQGNTSVFLFPFDIFFATKINDSPGRCLDSNFDQGIWQRF